MKKYRVGLVSLVLALFLVGASAFWWWSSRKTDFTEKDGTNTNAAALKEDIFFQELAIVYPQVYERIPEEGRATYTIPGVIQTVSVISKGEDKGQEDLAEDMTPQGLAFVEDMVAISAYSKRKEFRSVIWLLDKESGEYRKTIVLPTNSHVGGMAYDPSHKLLWVTTTDKDNTAQISAMTLQQLQEDQFKETGEPISFAHIINLADIERSSYMTYKNNALYVGYFDKEELGHVGYFPLNKKGLPRKLAGQGDQHAPAAVYDTPEQVQGMTFFQDKIVFSQSYGEKDSRLLYFDNPGRSKWTSFEEETGLVEELILPAYMQQIVAESDFLYLLFESSAIQYRDKVTISPIDRIIKIRGARL